MNNPPNEGFWRAALRFYGKPGAAETLLTLQDMHQGDVMAALWVLTASAHNRLLTAADITAYERRTACAAKQAKTLRAARRRLKSGPPGPYEAAKQAELAAERAIAAAAPDPAAAGGAAIDGAAPTPRAALAAKNFGLLFQHIALPLSLHQKLLKLIDDA